MRKGMAIGMALVMVLTGFMAMAPNVAAESCPTVTDTYVSDTNELWWAGATSGDIDGSGYIIPSSSGWSTGSTLCWVHPNWNGYLTPSDLKAKLFASPSANWIWKSYQVTYGESVTGDIVFFKKQINIPENAFNIQADLLVITADNAYYFYVNDDWSGTPVGSDGFGAGFDATNFYYTSYDPEGGAYPPGGGTNSFAYETVGNLYPRNDGVPAVVGYWSSLEEYDISSLLTTGENWLQIVAINEHAPSEGPTNNPAGLIYKVEVTYELATIEKTVVPNEGWLGDTLHIALDVCIPCGYTMTVRDVLPSDISYLYGTFLLDGETAVPTVEGNTISIDVDCGVHTIEFDVIVDSVEHMPVTVTNWAYIIYDSEPVAEDSGDIILYPYCGFHKMAFLESTGNCDLYLDVGEEIVWTLKIWVTNLFDWTMHDVVVTDRLGAELEIDEVIFVSTGEDSFVPTIRGNIKMTWTIGDLEPEETATLILEISTKCEKGKQKYTSPGHYELNSGATLKFMYEYEPDYFIQLSAHTGPIEFDVPGEWPEYESYCIRYPESGNAYIGYEDWPNGDFDYNDFGMKFSVEETYDINWNLVRVKMKFTMVIYDSGAYHDIHINRPIVGSSTYFVSRSNTAYGSETSGGTYLGAGPVDVTLFDTLKYPWPTKKVWIGAPNDQTDWVEIVIYTGNPSFNPKVPLSPPRTITNGGVTFTDLDPIMANYDPWMRAYLPFSPWIKDWHITNIQYVTGVQSGPGAAYLDQRLINLNLPHILVVPYTDWIPPYEDTCISRPDGQKQTPNGDWDGPYDYFYDFYSTGDSTYEDWYATITNTYVGLGGISWAP